MASAPAAFGVLGMAAYFTIKRGGRELVPGGQTRLQAGDEIVAAISGDVPGILTQLENAVRYSDEDEVGSA